MLTGPAWFLTTQYLYVDHLSAVEMPAEEDALDGEGQGRAQVVQVLRQQTRPKNEKMSKCKNKMSYIDWKTDSSDSFFFLYPFAGRGR